LENRLDLVKVAVAVFLFDVVAGPHSAVAAALEHAVGVTLFLSTLYWIAFPAPAVPTAVADFPAIGQPHWLWLVAGLLGRALVLEGIAFMVLWLWPGWVRSLSIRLLLVGIFALTLTAGLMINRYFRRVTGEGSSPDRN
jgi:hypothetical protein